MCAPSTVTEALAAVHAGLAFLNQVAAAELPGAVQAGCLRELARAESAYTAAHARMLAGFAASGAHEDDGQQTERAWLKWQTQITGGAAAGAVGWATRLAAHPAVAAALAEGAISPSWARHICAWTGQLPEDGRGDADEILLAAAAGGAVLPDLAALAEEMRRRTAVPDPGGPDGDAGFDERRVRLGVTFGGAGVLEGELTPACAAALAAVLEALGKKAGPEDTRTAPQRRHDALEEACRRLIGARCLPDRAGQPTQVQLHLTLEQLRDLPGAEDAEAAWRAAQSTRAAAEGQPGWLAGRAAEGYACDAAITPIVTGQLDQRALEALAAEIRATTRTRGPQHPPSPAALARLHGILLRHATAILSGPGGLAAFLRTRLTGDQFPSVSLPLDAGTPANMVTPCLRRAILARDRHCALPRLPRPTGRLPGASRQTEVQGRQNQADQPDPALRLPPPDRRAPMGLGPTLNADGTITAVSPDRSRTLHSHGPPSQAA